MVVVPAPMTWTFGRSSRLKVPPAPPAPVMKMATLSPGFTKPATRAGSVRLTEIAILPLGMVSPLAVPVAPNLELISCSPG